MSAANEDALKVQCGLGGCERPPGEPCVNSADGRGPRDEPHWNRVARARRLGDVSTAEWRAVMGMPPLMPGGESTSARLRQVQADLAASQADLTRVTAERDRFIAAADKLHGEWLDLKAELRRVEQERDEARQLLGQVQSGAAALAEVALERRRERNNAWRERDLARAELATASKEVRLLRAARQWVVARDGDRYCERCEQEIRRGEAYELLPDVDQLRHIHCRTEGAT